MIDILAVSDKVIVHLNKKENKTDGGLYIPDTAVSQTPQNSGEVLSVGKDVVDIEVGDVALFHERGGMDILLGKVLLKVLKYDEIYAVLKNKPAVDELLEDRNE